MASLLICVALIGQSTYGQNKAIIFCNDLNAYYSEQRPKYTLNGPGVNEPRINEIILNPDATFEFWSRPNRSCFTWHNYKGTWNKNNDTLIFYNSYEVEENGSKIVYKRDTKLEFVITFKTDKGSVLKNKNIKVEYVYDYDARIDSPEKIFTLDENNSLVISYEDVPNLEKLATIRVEYLLNYTDKRDIYLTENKFINVKQVEVPNLLNVEIVERPKREIVFRTIKAIMQNDTLKIVSSSKTNTLVPDYIRDIEFEGSYSLSK